MCELSRGVACQSMGKAMTTKPFTFICGAYKNPPENFHDWNVPPIECRPMDAIPFTELIDRRHAFQGLGGHSRNSSTLGRGSVICFTHAALFAAMGSTMEINRSRNSIGVAPRSRADSR